MAVNKKSFILYSDMLHICKLLTDDQAGKLLKLILLYVNDEDPITEDLILKLAFEPIKQQLKRDLRTWESSQKKQSNAGQLGNLKRWQPDLYQKVINKKLTLAKAQVIAKGRNPIKKVGSVAVNVNVNDNVNVIKKKDIEKRIAEFDNSLQPFNEKYGLSMTQQFYEYWSEKKPNGQKMRFEMEKTWDVGRRLKRWSDNNFKKEKKVKTSAAEILQKKYGIN